MDCETKAPPTSSPPGRGPGGPLLVHALGCVDLGDSFARSGDRDRALHYYGSAINDYLDAGLYDLAAAVCARMLDRFPDVVRARFTRAFLALGKELHRDDADVLPLARAHLADYVEAARRASQQIRAVEQLRRLARCTDRVAVVELIAEQMKALGRPEDAREVVETFRRRPRLWAPGRDELDRWAEILRGGLNPRAVPAAVGDALGRPAPYL